MMEPCTLVVDDSQSSRRLLSALLRREGYLVTTAASASEALVLAATSEFALVCTDLELPGMDGCALTRALLSRFPGVPVVAVTGHGCGPRLVDAMASGCRGHIAKPLNVRTFGGDLARILAA
ncbi:MAG: response regulator [Deltaproteobacteria bacterium]|nr:MAG: response regulator [Deltaproteobacteria bacterium]